MQTEAAAPQHSLAHYAANPEALANMTDDQLDALANAPSDPEVQPVVQGETNGGATPGTTSTVADPDQAKAAATPATTPAADAETAAPKGVQAKDGTQIIPFSVLERERDRRHQAEATANALAEEIERLKAGGKPANEAVAIKLTDEDLAQLDSDLPGVAKAFRAQMALIEQLGGTVQSLQREHAVQQSVQQLSTQDAIEAAIAANPDIASWREAAESKENPDPLMWDRAVNLDAVLRDDPAWQDRSLSERFAKVAETIKTLYGAPSAAPTAALPTVTPDVLKAKADAALASAATAGAVPRSSSDIPGGSAPPVDELAAMSDKSGAQLTAEFMAMTPDQIEARLSRLR
jgi:hypothetical protein